MMSKQPSCSDTEDHDLLHFDAARRQILAAVGVIKALQRVPIEQACGRALGNDIIAPIDVPVHANSAVDGYAVRFADLPENNRTAKLQIVGVAYAGRPYEGSIGTNQCIRIMTGAAIPVAVDTVIMQEHTELHDAYILVDGPHHRGQNIRQAGEDLQQHQRVLQSGRWLRPADIGLIASQGITEIDVIRKLIVAVASTGEELTDIGNVPEANRRFDSNRYSLMAALARLNIEVIDLGIIPDQADILSQRFEMAARSADIIIATGGVSTGDADYTKTALKQTGAIMFRKVAIKPGRPLTFGSIAKKPFFGLPGNPVAALVAFYQFVLPALEKMQGINDKPASPIYEARALQRIDKKAGRTEIQRGILESTDKGEWTVRLTGNQGSGILHSMSEANAFIILPQARTTVHSGEWVTVQPFVGLI